MHNIIYLPIYFCYGFRLTKLSKRLPDKMIVNTIRINFTALIIHNETSLLEKLQQLSLLIFQQFLGFK